jgi:hypothetical protein
MKALDTTESTIGKEQELLGLGYQAVGIYLRKDRAPLAMVKALRANNFKIFSIWEKGYPNSDAYFTAAQGKSDGAAAATYAKLIGQTVVSQIFAAVDYDADWATAGSAIVAYFRQFQLAVKAAGFLASVYGSGSTCAQLTNLGYAHSGYLSESTGWRGYTEFEPKASIMQGKSTTIAGISVDTDTVLAATAVW